MTRIILQRCFLVLAFTGILLSRAQDATVSDVSDSTPKSSEQTSPSAPDISFTSVATASHKSSSHSEASTSAPKSEFGASGIIEKSSQSVGTASRSKEELKEQLKEDSAAHTESERSEKPESGASESREKSGNTAESTKGPSLAHSEGLFKTELQDDEPKAGESTKEKLQNSPVEETAADQITKDPSTLTTSGSNPKVKSEAREVTDATTRISVVTEISEAGGTTRSVAFQSAELQSLDNSPKDSGQSSVPSKEDVISNTSDVDKNKTPEEMFSTTTSKVQTDEDDESEDNAKSATRKRSLNATSTLTKGTTVASSELPGSPGLDTSSHTVLPSATTEAKTVESVTEKGEVAQKQQTEIVSPDTSIEGQTDDAENSKIVSSTVSEVTESPHAINSDETSAVHSTQDEHLKSEVTSISPLHDTRMLPISSAALSSFSEESIHPSENIDTTAQVSGVGHDASTISTPWRSPELEVEDPAPGQDSDSFVSTFPPVTFDPNGVTHNFSQDPDSVTFTPEVFHVDGMPTDGYLSRLEKGESADQRPAVLPDLVKFTSKAPGTNSSDMADIHASEREREGISTADQGVLPHDEPDVEEMSNRNTVRNTEQPTIDPNFTGEFFSIHSTGTPQNTKGLNPLTDESEEMLNDSPHFGQPESRSTMASITDAKNDFISKDLEMNVSNDISHTTSASSQDTAKVAHELDFSIDYQPQQSEIRPVTVTSPLKTSESITIPSDFFNSKVGTQAPPEVTKSEQPETVLPDASSPIVLPNPAPSVVNQSTEGVTVVEAETERNASGVESEGQNHLNGSPNSTNSTIAGVAVKTSVSVSLPLSKTPNNTVSSTTPEIIDDSNASQSVFGIILPLPIPINKDADGHPPPTVISTEASTEASTVSTGLRIRKPKLKIGESSSSDAPRTRKPFLSPPQKSSTTVGPPVSIFKNARTRINSITSSTTGRPFPQFSTFRIDYANRQPGMMPNGGLPFSLEPTTTTEATTTETEEPFSDEPFTEQTQGPSLPNDDDVTLIKIAGYIVVDKGLRWNDQLINRHSPQYKEKSKYVQMQLDRLFRTSPIASRLWKTEIDGFSGKRKTRSVAIDFFLYIIKSQVEISTEQIRSVFHEKLVNNTFSRFTVDPTKTAFEVLNEEPMVSTTEAPETEPEPVIPQWAIAVIVVGAASLIFVVLFAIVAIIGRHHMRRRYSNKLNDEDSDRPSDWESKMAAAYENLAADTIYDAEDLQSDTYKKKSNSTLHGRPSRPQRADSWSSSDWSPPPRRPRPQVHRIVY